MCWAVYGLRPEELDDETTEWLAMSYIRRKRWEFDQQAAAVLIAYGNALSGKSTPQPTTTTATAPARPGIERSRTGKVFTRVSASQLMNVVQARRLPPQG